MAGALSARHALTLSPLQRRLSGQSTPAPGLHLPAGRGTSAKNRSAPSITWPIPTQRSIAASSSAAPQPATSHSSPAQDQAVPHSSRPTTAEFARSIMDFAQDGSLSTILQGKGEGEGLPSLLPLGLHVAYVLDATGRPVLALPPHSLAVANLAENSQCSLHVQIELPGLQKPQVTICGRATAPQDAASAMSLELAWNRKSGDSSGHSDRVLWLLSVDRILVANDVDQEPVWVEADEFLEAEADPLKDVARGIVEDMNREHWQDMGRICHAFAGIEDEVDEASITWVDRLGFDMRVWVRSLRGDGPEARDVRIPFAREATDEREARSNITMMVQVAWEKERNYNPQVPSIFPAPVAENTEPRE